MARSGLFRCIDCGVDTNRTNEYYMVHDHIWTAAFKDGTPTDHSGKPTGMLCVGCLESRLGRELGPDDFTDYPINTGAFHKSERLKSRQISSNKT